MATGRTINHPRPMKAHGYHSKRVAKTEGPWLVQPKLDGLRCMTFWEEDKLVMMSYGQKEFLHVEHIRQELELIVPRGFMLDGELYVHGVSFQKVMSMVKREQPDNLLVRYMVYDGDDQDGPMRQIHRHDLISQNLEAMNPKYTEYLTTVVVHDIEDGINRWHKQFLEDGFEGTIVRNPSAMYEYDTRSYNVLKHKSWQDEEFEIISVRSGVGKFLGVAIMICKTKDGKEFDCAMNIPTAEAKELYEIRDTLIGKMLKVKFFEKTDSGCPRFPRGLGVREAYDM